MARDVADEVLVFAPSGDTAAGTAYRRLGFEPALERVMLGA
jgi:hypothetical protein